MIATAISHGSRLKNWSLTSSSPADHWPGRRVVLGF